MATSFLFGFMLFVLLFCFVFFVVMCVFISKKHGQFDRQLRELRSQLEHLYVGSTNEQNQFVRTASPLEQKSEEKIKTPNPYVMAETPFSMPVSIMTPPSEKKNPEPSPPPAVAAAPTQPSAVENAIRTLFNFFTTGNVVLKAGIAILICGISFLLKFASDKGYFPVELRLMGIAILALVLVGLGWKLRHKKSDYALLIQGTGLAIFYLNTFAAYRIFHLIPSLAAFATLVLLTFFSSVMAMGQDSQALAVVGILGAFLAPILTSSGSGNYIALFSYYSVINAGILFIAFKKTWRPLNLIGFWFTFTIGLLWGTKYYVPENFSSLEPFLILFFFFYVMIPILFAKNQKPELKGFVDGTLIFGTPVAFMILQQSLMKEITQGLTITTFILTTFYIGLAWFFKIKTNKNFHRLTEAFLALGTIFLTLTIPIALEGEWTSAFWAIEAVGLIWIGIRQNRLLPQFFGILVLTTSAFTDGDQMLDGDFFITGLGGLVVSLSAFLSAFFLFKQDAQKSEQKKIIPHVHYPVWIWAIFIWCHTGNEAILNFVNEIAINSFLYFLSQLHVPLRDPVFELEQSLRVHLFLFFGIVTAFVLEILRRRLRWHYLRHFQYFLLIYTSVLALVYLFGGSSTFNLILVTGPFYFAQSYWFLKRNEEDIPRQSKWLKVMHLISFWQILIWLTVQIIAWTDHFLPHNRIWGDMLNGLIPAVFFILILKGVDKISWPFKKHTPLYLNTALVPLLFYLLGWSFLLNLYSPGDVQPLFYLPLLNPIDMTLAIIFFCCALWVMRVKNGWKKQTLQRFKSVAAILTFFWFNAILLRTIHNYAEIPFYFDEMYDSLLVQMSLSIYWCLIAMGIMITAARRNWRVVWISGACLLGLIVIKLIFIDFFNRGTVERIISSIVVGILFLVIGYFSPLPPKQQELK